MSLRALCVMIVLAQGECALTSSSQAAPAAALIRPRKAPLQQSSAVLSSYTYLLLSCIKAVEVSFYRLVDDSIPGINTTHSRHTLGEGAPLSNTDIGKSFDPGK